MADGKVTAAEKKRIESLDRRIEKLEEEISAKRRECDTLSDELQQLLNERCPERKEESIKARLYDAYRHSEKSLDEILAFMEGRDDEIDW